MDEHIIEHSQQNLEASRVAGIQSITQMVPKQAWLGECIECGDEILQKRAAAGYRTCIFCAEALEKQRQHYR